MAEERFEKQKTKILKYNVFVRFCELKFKFFCCSLSTAFDYKKKTLLELDIDYAVKKYSLKAIF